MRVLIIEDNPDILANLYGYLEPLGYVIDSARSGEAGLAASARGPFDAIVLDLMLPGIDGLEVCRRLRQEHQVSGPILMLTARDTIQDKVDGFGSGADDYLVKPFSLAELDVRLKALVRRARDENVLTTLRFGDLTYDRRTRMATRSGRPVELTPTGHKLLGRLLQAAPAVVTRQTLEFEVWGDDPPPSDALRTHIHALRQAVDKPFASAMIETVQGVGFRLIDASP